MFWKGQKQPVRARVKYGRERQVYMAIISGLAPCQSTAPPRKGSEGLWWGRASPIIPKSGFLSRDSHSLISWGCHSPRLETGLAEMGISFKTVWLPKETCLRNENKKGENDGKYKQHKDRLWKWWFVSFILSQVASGSKGLFHVTCSVCLPPFSCARLSPSRPHTQLVSEAFLTLQGIWPASSPPFPFVSYVVWGVGLLSPSWWANKRNLLLRWQSCILLQR